MGVGHGGGPQYQHRSDEQYEYVDQPTHLLRASLSSLAALFSSGTRGGGDPNALPPLVYQLGLLPMSTTARTGGGGRKANSFAERANESKKHREIRLRRTCMEGIAAVLDDNCGSCSGGNDNIMLHGGNDDDRPSNNTKGRERRHRRRRSDWRGTRRSCILA